MLSLILGSPPNSCESLEEIAISMPSELKNIKGINIKNGLKTKTIDEVLENIHSKFKTAAPIKIQLAFYTLSSIRPIFFVEFIDSHLLRTFIQDFKQTLENPKTSHLQLIRDLDNSFSTFLSINIKQIIRFLEAPIIMETIEFLVDFKMSACIKIIRAILIAKRLHQWIRSTGRSPHALVLILEPLTRVCKQQIPLSLMCEIAQSLVIIALLLSTIDDPFVEDASNALASCITSFLWFMPKSFSTPTVAALLNKIPENTLMASGHIKMININTPFSLRSALQLVRITLNTVVLKDQSDILNAGSICDAAKIAIIRTHEPPKSKDKTSDDEDIEIFLHDSLAYVEAAKNYVSESVPKDIESLAIFLNSASHPNVMKVALSMELGRILLTILETISKFQSPCTDLKKMISCCAALSQLLSQKPHEDFSAKYFITPHFIHLCLSLSDVIIYSPLYPHKPSRMKNVPSFLLMGAMKDLGNAIGQHPIPLIDFLINVPRSTPGRVKLLGLAIKGSNDKKQWSSAISINSGFLMKFTLDLLCTPTAIGCRIAAETLLAIAHGCISGAKKLIAPLFLSAIETTVACESCIDCAQTAFGPFFNILGFLLVLCQDPLFKTFALINVMKVCPFLEKWLNPNKANLGGPVTARILDICAALSNFDNSVNPSINGYQRLVFDVPYHNFLRNVVGYVNILDLSKYRMADRVTTAISALEFLLTLCSPAPVASLVRSIVDFKNVEKLASIVMECGTAELKERANSLLSDISSNIFMSEADSNDIEAVQSSVKNIWDIFYGLIDSQLA